MSPKAARTVSRGRIYTINGQSLWSVTTILSNGLPKPAIANWQANTIADFAVANHRQLAGLLEAVRLQRGPAGTLIVSDPDAVEGAVEWLKGSPWRESKRKMNIGSAVHIEAEAYILGAPRPEPAPLIAAYLASFRNFLEDHSPVFLATEATVYSMAESYAGTLDAIVEIGGRRLLIDYKTGKAIYPDVCLQLAAYAHAEKVLLDDGTSVDMLPVDGAAALHLREYDPTTPDDRGYSLIPASIDEPVWDAFRYVREVMRWQEDVSKGVLSQPLGTPAAVAFLYPDLVPKDPPAKAARRKAAPRPRSQSAPVAERGAA
jgi:hypothetical protein